MVRFSPTILVKSGLCPKVFCQDMVLVYLVTGFKTTKKSTDLFANIIYLINLVNLFRDGTVFFFYVSVYHLHFCTPRTGLYIFPTTIVVKVSGIRYCFANACIFCGVMACIVSIMACISVSSNWKSVQYEYLF